MLFHLKLVLRREQGQSNHLTFSDLHYILRPVDATVRVSSNRSEAEQRVPQLRVQVAIKFYFSPPPSLVFLFLSSERENRIHEPAHLCKG